MKLMKAQRKAMAKIGGWYAARETDTMIILNVVLVFNLETPQAADTANNILREQQAQFCPTSCLIDYAVGNHTVQIACDPAMEVESDTFAYPNGRV
jgi:hypothetical protein